MNSDHEKEIWAGISFRSNHSVLGPVDEDNLDAILTRERITVESRMRENGTYGLEGAFWMPKWYWSATLLYYKPCYIYILRF